jgi:hypothetical protein
MIARNRKILTLLLLTNSGCATVQLASTHLAEPFDPLGLPTSALLCHVLTLPNKAPPNSIGFQFQDGTLLINDRLISAVYDSVGNPMLLIMNATEKPVVGDAIMHSVSVSFPKGEPGIGFQFVNPRDDTIKSQHEPLSPSMIKEAQNLAAWLWNHRCVEVPVNKGITAGF